MTDNSAESTPMEAEQNLVLDAAPEDIRVLVAVGQEYYRQGEPVKAEKVFRGAYVLSKGSAEILRFVGATLHAQSRLEEALTLYNQALLDLPDDPQLCYNKGELLVLFGQYTEAEELLQKFVEMSKGQAAFVELQKRAETMLTLSGKLKQIADSKQEEALAAEVSSGLNQALTGASDDEGIDVNEG